MKKALERLGEELKPEGILLTEVQKKQLLTYYELLIEKNKVMNLTAITEPEDVMIRHFLDSLMLIRAVSLQEAERVIDVGTGAGFPGIPVKIVFPHLKLTLMDSLGKRVHFLEETVGELGLSEVTCIHGRAEDLGRDSAHREQYDLCVSRAVSNLATLSEYCLPFVKEGGRFVSYKSGDVEEEMEQARKAVYLLGGAMEEPLHFDLPGTEIHRSLVSIIKVKKCPRQYPRKAGLPGKQPIT